MLIDRNLYAPFTCKPKHEPNHESTVQYNQFILNLVIIAVILQWMN